MKLLVDAQLPARLAVLLRERGNDALHTSDMPDGNRSTDRQIAERVDADARVLVTKDRSSETVTSWRGRRDSCSSSQPATSPTTTFCRSSSSTWKPIVSGFEDADFAELSQDALAPGHRADRGDS